MADSTPRANKATGAAKKPPAAKKAAGATRPPGRPSNDTKLAESVATQYAALGMVLPLPLRMLGVDPRNAKIASLLFAECGTDCADAWVELAKTNPGVRRRLESTAKAGGWAAVLTQHVALGIGVAIACKAPLPEEVDLSPEGAVMMAQAIRSQMGSFLDGASHDDDAG